MNNKRKILYISCDRIEKSRFDLFNGKIKLYRGGINFEAPDKTIQEQECDLSKYLMEISHGEQDVHALFTQSRYVVDAARHWGPLYGVTVVCLIEGLQMTPDELIECYFDFWELRILEVRDEIKAGIKAKPVEKVVQFPGSVE